MPARPTDSDLRCYLLGTMSADEAEALEIGYFANPDLREHVAAVESDLVDEYVAGRLPADERLSFERHYLVSRPHRDRVALAKALRAATAAGRSAASSSRRVVGPWAWAAALLASVGAAWLWQRTPAGQERTTSLHSPSPSAVQTVPPPRSPGVEPTPSPRPPASGAPERAVFVVALSPLLLRSAEGPSEVVLPPGAEDVEIRLEGEADAIQIFDFDIRTVEGRKAAAGRAFPPSRETSGGSLIAVVRVSAALLPADDYILTLSPVSRPGEAARPYFLRVRRQH